MDRLLLLELTSEAAEISQGIRDGCRGRCAENCSYTPHPVTALVPTSAKEAPPTPAPASNMPTAASPAPTSAKCSAGRDGHAVDVERHENGCDVWSTNPVMLSVLAFVNSTCGIRKLYWIAPLPQVEKYPISP